MLYRGYEITARSVVGGLNISKDGDFVDSVIGDAALARSTIDTIIEEGGA